MLMFMLQVTHSFHDIVCMVTPHLSKNVYGNSLTFIYQVYKDGEHEGGLLAVVLFLRTMYILKLFAHADHNVSHKRTKRSLSFLVTSLQLFLLL